MSDRNYKNEQDAAKSLLGEAVKIITECHVDYVVVGGWIPYLFHTSQYPHPGSFDVDLLLNAETTTKEQMESAVKVFRSHGYLFSAKNKFQLHKILIVNDEPIIFHVDFLHRKYAPDQDQGMFLNWNAAISIAGPGTDIIFLNNERVTKSLSFDLPDNTTDVVNVNFTSEIGFLSSKGRSLDTPKRVRDSYDIFLIICQSNDHPHLILKSAEYYKTNMIFKTSIDNIYNFFSIGDSKGNNGVANAKRYLEQYRNSVKFMPDQLDEFIIQKVCGFIEKIRR